MADDSLIQLKFEEFRKAKQKSLADFGMDAPAPKPAPKPVEAPKAEAPKVEAPQVEAPKAEAPKAEAKPAVDPTLSAMDRLKAQAPGPARDVPAQAPVDNGVKKPASMEMSDTDKLAMKYMRNGQMDYAGYYGEIFNSLPREEQMAYEADGDTIDKIMSIPEPIRSDILNGKAVDAKKYQGFIDAYNKWLKSEKAMTPEKMFAGVMGQELDSPETKKVSQMFSPLTKRSYPTAIGMAREIVRQGALPKDGKSQFQFVSPEGEKFIADASIENGKLVLEFEHYDRVTNKPKVTKKEKHVIPLTKEGKINSNATQGKVNFWYDVIGPHIDENVEANIAKIPEYSKMWEDVFQNVKRLENNDIPKLKLVA